MQCEHNVEPKSVGINSSLDQFSITRTIILQTAVVQTAHKSNDEFTYSDEATRNRLITGFSNKRTEAGNSSIRINTRSQNNI